jgi:hypothetical protein
MTNIAPESARWKYLASMLSFWPIVVLLGLVVFRLLGGSSKIYSNLFYVGCLLPALVYWKSTFALVREEKVFLGILLGFSAYCTISGLVLYGREDGEVKSFLLLVLFFGFVRRSFSVSGAVDLFSILLLFLCVTLLAWGVFDFYGVHLGERVSFYDVNPNRSSPLFAYAFFWLMWLGIGGTGWRSFLYVLLSITLLLLLFYLLESRSLFICLLIFVVVAFFENRRGTTRWAYLWLAGCLLLLLGILVQVEPLQQRLITRGSSYRFEIWADALAYMRTQECYVFGCGKHNGYRFLGVFENPHGIFVSVLLYYGLIGVFAFLCFLAYCLFRLKGFYRAWFCAFLAYGVFTHTTLLGSPTLLWVYFWLPLALGIFERRETHA